MENSVTTTASNRIRIYLIAQIKFTEFIRSMKIQTTTRLRSHVHERGTSGSNQNFYCHFRNSIVSVSLERLWC